jgi:cytochrome oxidase assembly protein ShyY1
VAGAAAAPTGRVTVSGLALPPDSISASPVSPAPSVVTRIDLGVAALPYRLVPVYVLLQTQDPAQASGSPIPGLPPTLDEGPHLSYAIQWFAFATIAIVGCVVLLRRDPKLVGE